MASNATHDRYGVTTMKALLWVLLTASVLFNVSTSFISSGVTQVLLSIPSGLVVIGSAVGLWLLRDRKPA
ncbi:hypothetical protein [Streptomyces sp. NBC_01304]|uniref:hypothetical protein n=1 Tax=Streptomyces sp. NBC_01304 TaxID=2903818 RepID=UPI002E15C54B|nr:hypothetical protein OG430_10260 [Streptomyces sp. NBC_01304]